MMSEEKTQTYVTKDNIQELEVFSWYSEAVEHISNLNNQSKKVV